MKAKSRKNIYKGEPSASIAQLRIKIKAKEEANRVEELQKAQKKLSITINKAKKELTAAGIQTRKDNKARLERIQEIRVQGDFPEPSLLALIREPNKNPIFVKQACLLEDFYPKLV